jgi:hypothetical protein
MGEIITYDADGARQFQLRKTDIVRSKKYGSTEATKRCFPSPALDVLHFKMQRLFFHEPLLQEALVRDDI